MKRLLIVAASTLIIAGCATSSQTVGPSGNVAFSVTCGAAVIGACYEKAGKVCPHGYTIVAGRGAENLGQISQANASASWNRSGGTATASGFSVPLISPNNMLVECKP